MKYETINPYYIIDTTNGKKYNHTETCKLLNHQQRMLQMKTELIMKLIRTNDALTSNIKQLQEEKTQEEE